MAAGFLEAVLLVYHRVLSYRMELYSYTEFSPKCRQYEVGMW